MFRKLISVVVLGSLLASSLVLIAAKDEPNVSKLRYQVQTRQTSGGYKFKAAFNALSEAEAAMARGDRLIVTSPTYAVRHMPCAKTCRWDTLSTHSTLVAANEGVAKVDAEYKSWYQSGGFARAHVAEYVITAGCKLPTTYVAYRLEDAKELLAALKESGRLVNSEELVISGEERP